MASTHFDLQTFISCLLLAMSTLWVTPASGGQLFREQLLSPARVPYQGSFTVSCHLYLLKLRLNHPQVQRVTRLQLSYNPLCASDSKNIRLATMTPLKNSIELPNLRRDHPNWNVSFEGELAHTDELTKSMEIVMTVGKAVHEESGSFLCQVHYESRNNEAHMVQATDYMKVAWGEPLLSVRSVDSGDSVKVRCRLTNFEVPEGTTQVEDLTLSFRPGNGHCWAGRSMTLGEFHRRSDYTGVTNNEGWSGSINGRGAPNQKCNQHIEIEIKSVNLYHHIGNFTCVLTYIPPHGKRKKTMVAIEQSLRLKSPPLPVLDKTEVSVGDSVTATCDLSRVTLYPRVRWVDSVHLITCTGCACWSVGRVVRHRTGILESDLTEFKNRKRLVTKTLPVKDPKTLQVKLVISSNVTTGDLGSFSCNVRFQCEWGEDVALSSNQSLEVKEEREDILSIGKSVLIINCYQHVMRLFPGSSYIDRLIISRQTDLEKDFKVLASVRTFGPSDNHLLQDFPPGRKWTLNQVGTDITNEANIRKIRISIIISDVQCQDSGQYKCVMGADCTVAEAPSMGLFSRVQRFDAKERGFCPGGDKNYTALQSSRPENSGKGSMATATMVLLFLTGFGAAVIGVVTVGLMMSLKTKMAV